MHDIKVEIFLTKANQETQLLVEAEERSDKQRKWGRKKECNYKLHSL